MRDDRGAGPPVEYARRASTGDDRLSAQPDLSAVVIAQDDEDTIGACLDALAFADEVVLVDGGSTDETVRVAREHGARVFENPWPGFAAQWRFAISRARGRWVLIVASDEIVTPALAAAVREAVTHDGAPGGGEGAAPPRAGAVPLPGGARAPGRPAGYRVARRNHFLGVPVRHGPWARDRQLRLVRRDRVRVSEARVHEGFVVDGPVGDLDGELVHHTHRTLTESLDRMNRYTSLEAADRAGGRRVRRIEVFSAPVATFLAYWVRGGLWREGMPGFLLAATTALYRSMRYLKTYLAQHGGEHV